MSKKNSKKTVPELRFRGFTDPWEQRQLGEVGSATSGVGFPDAEQGGTDGLPFYKVSDMNLSGNESVMSASSNYVSAEQVVKNHWKPIATVPAIIFAKVGAAVFLDRKRVAAAPFLMDNNMMAYIPDGKSWAVDFCLSVFNRIRLSNLARIGALPSINASDVEQHHIALPGLPEQRLIGRFFSTLDSLIAAAERQETLLRQKKQAYLQLMFPCEGETQPRLRFSGFSGDWEQRQSSELFVPVKENGHSDLPVLSATQSEGMVYRDDQSRDIKFKKDNLGSYKLVRAGDFVISLRSFQGGFELSDKTGIVSPAYTVFTHAECSSQDNGYWKQYFKRRSFIESLKTVTFGIRDGKAISFSDFSSLKCIFPTLPEQRLIGRFFSTLDSLIAAAEERTRALKEMKSAYLQRMFV